MNALKEVDSEAERVDRELTALIPDPDIRMELSAAAQAELESGDTWEWFRLASNGERDAAVSIRAIEIAKDEARMKTMLREIAEFRLNSANDFIDFTAREVRKLDSFGRYHGRFV
jgi:hypothetical protein